MGIPNSPNCQKDIDNCVSLFGDWDISLHPNKLEGGTTCLTVLSIEPDSHALKACPPCKKFDRIPTLLEYWSLKQHCTRKELESLIGNLQHSCKLISQGHPFLWRMINLLSMWKPCHQTSLCLTQLKIMVGWVELIFYSVFRA